MTLAYEETINKFNASSKNNEYVLPIFVKEKSSEEFVGLYEIATDKIDASPLSVFMNVNFDNESGFGSHDALPDESLRVFRTEIKYLCFPFLGARYGVDIEIIKNIGSRCFKDKYLIVHDCQLAISSAQLAISSAQIKDRDPFRETSTYKPSTYELALKTYFGEIGCHTLQLNLEDYEYVFDSDKFIPIGNKQIKK